MSLIDVISQTDRQRYATKLEQRYEEGRQAQRAQIVVE